MNEAQRNIVLEFYEMKIHQGLVFDVETGLITWYVDTGDLNARLKSFEADIKEKANTEKEVDFVCSWEIYEAWLPNRPIAYQ
jgi:hypothetical protein